jgi:hypothetical protein
MSEADEPSDTPSEAAVEAEPQPISFAQFLESAPPSLFRQIRNQATFRSTLGKSPAVGASMSLGPETHTIMPSEEWVSCTYQYPFIELLPFIEPLKSGARLVSRRDLHLDLSAGPKPSFDNVLTSPWALRRLKKISGASHRGSLTFCNNFAVCHSRKHLKT